MKRLNRVEINDLVEKYFNTDNPDYNIDAEQRLDINSGKVLYSLVRECKPETCLEFGTSAGGSAVIINLALQKNKKPFKYIGFEKLLDLLKLTAANILHKCGYSPELYGDITQNLDKIPEELDFVFIDPDWDIENYPDRPQVDIGKWTFENIIPRVKKGGLVCIHDWSVNEKLEYEGGGFPGIYLFIEKFKEGKMPLEKIFSMWDEEDFKASSHALSFWRKV